MNINNLSIVVAVLMVISASSERLVEIFKNLWGYLKGFFQKEPSQDNPESEVKKPNAATDAGRKFCILVVSFICCYITAYLSQDILPKVEGITWNTLALAVLAMGGSSFWNSIQGYLNGIKNGLQPINQAVSQAMEKQAEAQKKLAEVAALEAKTPQDVEAIQKLRNEAKTLLEAAAALLRGIGGK